MGIKIFELFDQSLVSSSHQNNKRTIVEDNVSEDGNLQLHGKIIDTVIGERQSGQNSDPESSMHLQRRMSKNTRK